MALYCGLSVVVNRRESGLASGKIETEAQGCHSLRLLTQSSSQIGRFKCNKTFWLIIDQLMAVLKEPYDLLAPEETAGSTGRVKVLVIFKQEAKWPKDETR
jgi:hypothetical protein